MLPSCPQKYPNTLDRKVDFSYLVDYNNESEYRIKMPPGSKCEKHLFVYR